MPARLTPVALLRMAFLLLLASLPYLGGMSRGLTEELPPGLVERPFVHADKQRFFLEYRPETFSQDHPVLIVLHGGGQSMRRMFRRPESVHHSWLRIAEREGVLVLAPNATNLVTGDAAGEQQSWNDLRQIRGDDTAAPDDVDFITALAAWAVAERGADPRRVYVAGASSGGMMVFRLLIERPAPFAAGAAFIASLPLSPVLLPSEARPLLMVNGTADPVVPWDGGKLPGGLGSVRSVEETLDFWLEAHHLADRPPARQVLLPDRVADDGCRITIDAYGPDAERPLVQLATMLGGGHTIPSAAGAPETQAVLRAIGQRCRDADGPELAWAFLARHRLPTGAASGGDAP